MYFLLSSTVDYTLAKDLPHILNLFLFSRPSWLLCLLASPRLTFSSQLLSMCENCGGEEKSLPQEKKRKTLRCSFFSCLTLETKLSLSKYVRSIWRFLHGGTQSRDRVLPCCKGLSSALLFQSHPIALFRIHQGMLRGSTQSALDPGSAVTVLYLN